MRAIDHLRRDHSLLRAWLDVLGITVGAGPQVVSELRGACGALSTQLERHMQREGRVIAAYRLALRVEGESRATTEHHHESLFLGVVNRHLAKSPDDSMDGLRPTVAALIDGLRCHMDAQEAELFPAMERVLKIDQEVRMDAKITPAQLHEEMTVNEVVKLCPGTRSAFGRLAINTRFEGPDCLDEVAWRHGMNVGELFTRLEQEVASRRRVPRRLTAQHAR